MKSTDMKLDRRTPELSEKFLRNQKKNPVINYTITNTSVHNTPQVNIHTNITNNIPRFMQHDTSREQIYFMNSPHRKISNNNNGLKNSPSVPIFFANHNSPTNPVNSIVNRNVQSPERNLPLNKQFSHPQQRITNNLKMNNNNIRNNINMNLVNNSNNRISDNRNLGQNKFQRTFLSPNVRINPIR